MFIIMPQTCLYNICYQKATGFLLQQIATEGIQLPARGRGWDSSYGATSLRERIGQLLWCHQPEGEDGTALMVPPARGRGWDSSYGATSLRERMGQLLWCHQPEGEDGTALMVPCTSPRERIGQLLWCHQPEGEDRTALMVPPARGRG